MLSQGSAQPRVQPLCGIPTLTKLRLRANIARLKSSCVTPQRHSSELRLSLAAKEPKWYSDTVSAIYVPDGFDATDVLRTAYDRYGLSFGAGLSKVAGKVFRIGHLGRISEIQLLGGIAGAEMAMRDCGINVEAGSGVAAASEYYRETAVVDVIQAAA